MHEITGESWNPRSWVADWGPAAQATSASMRADAGVPVRDTGMLDVNRRMAMAVAAAVAVLAVGAVTAHLSRTATPALIVADAASPSSSQTPPQVKRTLVLSGVGDLAQALQTDGLAATDAQAAAAAARPGLASEGEIRAIVTLDQIDGKTTLARLDASNPDSSGVVVTPAAPGVFVASKVAAQLTSKVIVRRGKMDVDSFYSSAVAAGVTDSLIADFAKALSFDFDFQREVGVGDAFEAAFSQPVDSAGNPVGQPTLLYASMSTATKTAAVYRFAVDGGSPEWFDGSGRSIVRTLMRTPVDGARVSSTFGMRVHPVLGFMKMHKGIDFAAPVGTPIYAAGDGVVTWSGMKGPNGNLVILRHDNGWLTYYLHQNRILPQVVVGARVSQGQQIGEIGTTGRSTGPHLHYEVHINDEAVDPLSIPAGSGGRTLGGPALIAFGKVRDMIDVNRADQTK